MGGVEGAAAYFADAVPGASDALQGRGHGGWRLHQHHLVESADIDAEFQRTRGDDGAQLASLQALLHFGSNVPGQRAVVRVGQRRGLVLVDLEGHLLGQAPAVGEEQGRPVAFDDAPETLGQRIPDFLPVGGGIAGIFRKAHPKLDRLVLVAGDHLHRPGRAVREVAADVSGHGIQGPDRGGKGDALKFSRNDSQPFDGRHQLHAAAIGHDRVHLVENERFHGRQRLPAPGGGEQQGQALRRGDQDVRGPAQHSLAIPLGGVAGTCSDADFGETVALPEFAQGPEQVPPDVVVECLQRRDVQDAGSPRPVEAGCESVEREEERGQCLAAAGGCRGQYVSAAGNAGPGFGLHVGGGGETPAKPSLNGRMKKLQDAHGPDYGASGKQCYASTFEDASE